MNILQKNFLRIFLLVMVAFGSVKAGAQIIGWDANNNGGGFGASPWTPAVKDPNITTTGLIRGSSIGTSGTPAGGCWGGANGWAAGTGVSTDANSFHFTVVAAPGYKVSLSSITTATRRSNSGPSGYTLYYSVNGGAYVTAGPQVSTSSTSGTTGTAGSTTLSSIAALQNVGPGTVIKFRINPVGDVGNYYLTGGTNSLRVNGTVTLSQPNAPIATAATSVVSTGFMANWNAVTGATGYRLDVATDAAFTQMHEIYDNFAVSGTSQFCDIDILQNTVYYYRVRAEVGSSTSNNSNVINLTTPNPVPATVVTTQILPADITVATATAGGNVTNDGQATVTARGTVYATTANPTTASSVTTNGTGAGIFTSSLSGLSPNMQYYYRAYATNSTGTTYGDEYSFWTHANTPGAPTVSNPGLFSLDVALDVNGNPAGTLYAIVIEGGGYENDYVTATGSVTTTPVWQTAAQWGALINVDVLQPNTAYTFSVSAQNGAGVQTPWSTTGTGTTSALAGPTTLTLITNTIDFEPACLSTNPEGAIGTLVFDATNLSGQGIGLGDVMVSGPNGAPLEGISFSGSVTGPFDEGSFLIEDVTEGADQTVYIRFDPTAGVSYGTMIFEIKLTDTMNSTAAPLTVNVVIVDLPTATAAQTVCNGVTVAELATTTGTNIRWYTAATGGTALATTEVLTAQTYYASQSIGDCESGRIAVVLTVNPIPTVAVAAPQAFCGPSTVSQLVVTTGEAPKWYAAETGGTVLAGTDALATANYYVTQTVNGCESPRTAVAITVNPIPALPVAATQAFCGPSTVSDLMVTTGTAPKWYAAETGGNELDADTAIATGTYYVSQTVNGCESLRAAVTVTVNPIPAAPVVDDVQPFCTQATVADLDATGVNIQWYTSSTGGTALAETTAITAGTSIYYASQTVNGCESTLRSAVAVQLTVTPAPAAAAQAFCGEATVSQLVSGGTAVHWYGEATGGTALAGTASLATGTYYVSQTINGCESAARTSVAVTVNAIPAAPTAAAQAFCGSAIVSELMVASGANAQWYAAETGGTALAGNTALETGTYYVSQTVNGCESARTAVEVTVNAVPAIPVTTPLTFCNAATVSELTATGENLQWYAAATGGTALGDTAAVQSGLYYVSQTVNGCESIRTAVQVTLNVTIAPTAAAQTFCNAATVADLAVTTGTAVKWYANATGGDELEATAGLATGTYYVSQTLNECEGPRTAVQVTLNVTAAPIAAAQTFCNAATVADLDVTTGTAVKWYSAATGGTELEAATALETGTYYVSQTVNECEGQRAAVEVTVTEVAAPEGEGEQEYEAGETLADLEVEGENIMWYEDEDLTMELPETTALVDGTTYYAVATEGECTSEALAVLVDEVLDTKGFDMASLAYYPNPVNDVLNLSYSEAISGVVVFNLLGQPVLSSAPDAGSVQIDMALLAAGTYVVKVTSGDSAATLKVIKR